jgi:flavin reductase (DIM6/NTAB) family NADH-FMN oxidoreductase RutF
MDTSDHARNTIGRALGRVPSGVFVLTASHDGRAGAMLASWVQQAAFAPPAVSVALAKERPIGALIRASGRFALSIIPKDNTSLMKHYARGVKDDEDAFAGVRTIAAESGVPVLADALGYLDCRVISTCDFSGDHELLVGEVTAGKLFHDGQSFTHVRGNGFHY